MDRDERGLIGGCLEGDESACAELVRRNARMVGSVILRATGDAASVEDLVQETFLRAFRALPYFDFRSKVSTWLCTIAHRLALEHLERQGRRVDRPAPLPEPVEPPAQAAASDPLAILEESERRALVHRCLEKLPERYRLALVYSAIDALGYEEIAAMMGVPLSTVKTFIHRGKLALRDLVLAEWRADVR